jgi:ATP-dependent helicase HepA
MEIFSENQRWISEGEPELGIGIVMETSKGRVRIFFPAAKEMRLYGVDNAPLRRVLFKAGDTILDADNRPMVVEKVREKDHLMLYYGGGRMLSEADLGDVSINRGVEEKLLSGEIDPPELFSLRRKTLYHDHQRRISSVSGFIGGRIDLIPHQLYIAHEVSRRYAPRVLLSDEVGLGKTIEACLILHRLLISGRISRVLILVPEPLISQWFVEMLRRFNLWFQIIDEEHSRATEAGAPEGNPFLADQLVISSIDFLTQSEKRTRQVISAEWDMLVVDEAHHLQWSVEEASQEYSLVELLSQIAKGLLLLTATPEQLGLESHFARLRLLDPERYSNFEAFKDEASNHKVIADLAEKIADHQSLTANETLLLSSLVSREKIKALSTDKPAARENLIEDLLDQHGPGRVIFRNTRSAMSGFPVRKAHLHALKIKTDSKLWIQRLEQEFAADIHKAVISDSQSEESEKGPPKADFWFKSDPRVKWLLQFMEEIAPAKVLLICRSKEKALALEETLRSRASFKLGVFYEDLTIIQRDRNAAWFSEPDGARLLICSEIGSEGRNFQFAHHLILFDLPFNPELLEQRIGRLDRIGQTEDIQIHVPFLKGSPQEVLVKWFHKGLNAFEKNLEGGNQFIRLFGERLLNLALASERNEQALAQLIAETATYQKELTAKLAKGRDRLLEMNSFRPRVADELVAYIRAEDRDLKLEAYLTEVFEHFYIEMEDLAPRTYALHHNHKNHDAFPSIPDEGVSITFDRKRALSREDLSFVSWDHPMAVETIDMILSTGAGSASFGLLKSKGGFAILLETLFVLETTGGKQLHVDRFLPNTPLRVVMDHTGDDVTELYPAELFDKYLMPGSVDSMLDNDTLVETVIPDMIDRATQIAEAMAEEKIATGLRKVDLTVNHEINRLKSLQEKNGNIRPEEIQIAIQERTELTDLIKSARVRLDAVLLIQKS